MKERILKRIHFSYIFALVIGALFMIQNVNALTLDSDSTEPIVIESGKNEIIDLNGKTLNISSSKNAITINKGAVVTIKGNGIVYAESAAIFNNGGTVTIENGTFSSSKFYTVKNLGKMTINGGMFGQTDKKNINNSSLIANGFYGDLGNDCGVETPKSTDESITEAIAVLTINGGTFDQYTTTSTIKSDIWSKTIINDGEFTSHNGTLIQTTGEVRVSGGNFVGFDDITLLNGTGKAIYQPASITITGGKFSANYIVWAHTDGTMKITGGDFTGVKKGIVDTYEKKEFNHSITGGLFNIQSDIYNYLKEGYDAFDTDNGLIINKAPEFKLNKKTYYVEKGKTIKIDYTANETGKKYLNVGSTDEKIATIKGDTITAISVGKTNIDCFVGGIGDEAEVIVYELKNDTNTKNGITKINDLIENINNNKTTKGIDEETKDKILDALKNGKAINTELNTKEIKENELNKEVKEKINKILNKNENIISLYDINVFITSDNNKLGKITEFDDKILIKLDVPKNLPELKTGYNRLFNIIRVHNGETTKIPAKLVNGKIEFETDKFSDYALTYTDQITEENTNKGKLDDVPKTSSVNYVIFFIVFSLLSIISIKLLKRN